MATVAPESAMAGLDPMFQPDWFFTDEQLRLLERLKEICEETIRPLAAENDRTLTFPRKSLEALAPDGFLGLMLPKEWGGLGQNHVMYAAVTETIARHGDASCAMCYVMHIGAVEALKLRATDYTIEKYLKKVREGKLGTLSYSDPETGSHFWYPIASGARRAAGGFEVLKKASWTTSAGFADFYVLQTTSPDYSGDYSNLSVFVVDAADIQAKPEEWDAMGLRGNQSGTLLLDWKHVPENQLVGLRLCDYPTIQDAVGEAIMDTNAARMFVYSVAQALDKVTDGSQTNPAVGELARGNYLHWLWQIKFNAAKNVAHVVDKMLHCCGGTGFKKQPLQLERYLRDGKAGWVMGPTNEVLRQFVGKTALLGMESLDYWNQVINQRAVDNELKKFTPEQKKELAERLLAEAGGNGAG